MEILGWIWVAFAGYLIIFMTLAPIAVIVAVIFIVRYFLKKNKEKENKEA